LLFVSGIAFCYFFVFGKVFAFIQGFAEDSIIEVVRSGPTGISRGETGLHL